jgi:hypothetical protein
MTKNGNFPAKPAANPVSERKIFYPPSSHKQVSDQTAAAATAADWRFCPGVLRLIL